MMRVGFEPTRVTPRGSDVKVYLNLAPWTNSAISPLFSDFLIEVFLSSLSLYSYPPVWVDGVCVGLLLVNIEVD